MFRQSVFLEASQVSFQRNDPNVIRENDVGLKYKTNDFAFLYNKTERVEPMGCADHL